MKSITALVMISLFFFTACKHDHAHEDAHNASKKVATEVAKKNEVKTISLAQTVGEFQQKSLTLKEGTYIFNIANKNVDHEVGFVLAPKGKTDQENHIKAAYVTAPVPTGSSSNTNEVTLTKGEYVYFCPLNPTPEYSLVVE